MSDTKRVAYKIQVGVLLLLFVSALVGVLSALSGSGDGEAQARAMPLTEAPATMTGTPTASHTSTLSTPAVTTTVLVSTITATLEAVETTSGPADVTPAPTSVETRRQPVGVHELRRPTAGAVTTETPAPAVGGDSLRSSRTLTPAVILLPTSTPTMTPTPEDAALSASVNSGPLEAAETGGLVITTPGPPATESRRADTGAPADDPALQLGGELPSFASQSAGMAGGYVVQEGDTAWSVSIEMGLDLAETPCAVAPDFSLDQPLVVGDVLEAPDLDVFCHPVQEGESPVQIAELYNIDPGLIVAENWNRIAADAIGQPLPAGSFVRVRIPAGAAPDFGVVSPAGGGFFAYMLEQPVSVSPYQAYAVGGPRAARIHEPVPANWPYGSGQFSWPAYGWLSQGYRNDHRALDIAAQPGTFVTAADRGVVIRAGWNNQGYGRFVVIDHNIDYVTLYAHLEQILVQEGEIVGQGQIIGTVGSTGNSTGPHLHFEIRDFGRRVNPIDLLVR